MTKPAVRVRRNIRKTIPRTNRPQTTHPNTAFIMLAGPGLPPMSAPEKKIQSMPGPIPTAKPANKLRFWFRRASADGGGIIDGTGGKSLMH